MFLEIDSNYQPSAYQAGALTIELPKNIVDTLGIEPIHSDCKSGGLPLTSGT